MKQTKLRKRCVSVLLLLSILMTSFTYQPTTKARAEEKKFLVLIETKKGLFTAYEDLLIQDSKKNLMIKAYAASKAIGLKYEKVSDKKFSITNRYPGNGSWPEPVKTLIYTKGSKQYDKKVEENRTTQYSSGAAYGTAKTETQPATNWIQYRTLGDIVNFDYFFNVEEYADYGYTDVIVYSKFYSVKSLPDITRVRDTKGNYRFPETQTNSAMKGSTMTIAGTKFPTVKGFKKPQTCADGAFGDDGYSKNDKHLYYDALNWFQEYIYDAMEKAGYQMNRTSNPIIYMDDLIMVSTTAIYNQPTMYMYKEEDHYEIKLFHKFGGKRDEIYKNCLKALIAGFTSDVDTVYDALLNSFEGDESCGINEKTWTKIGNTKIKVKVVDRTVVYSFKSAK